MLYILYSDDYEFCLGGNHRSERDVLIVPTERILRTAEALDVPFTLFADVACCWRYRELGMTDVVQQVEEQLREAVGRGHDVQTHLHPHWLWTDIETDRAGYRHYRFDWTRFLLGNCVPPDGRALAQFCVDVLTRARTYLTDLLAPVDREYRCRAFRAGGYGIQPRTEVVLAALEQAGYTIDSSVVPGLRLCSNVNQIDFRAAPALGNYHLTAATGLTQPASRGLFEIPVAACSIRRRTRLREYFRRWSQPPEPPVGYGIQQATRSRADGLRARVRQWQRRVRDLGRGWAMLELCDDAALMLELTHRYIRQHDRGDADLYFALSCHSKTTTVRQLAALQTYHRELTRYYGGRLQAIHYQQADRLLEGQGQRGGQEATSGPRAQAA